MQHSHRRSEFSWDPALPCECSLGLDVALRRPRVPCKNENSSCRRVGIARLCERVGGVSMLPRPPASWGCKKHLWAATLYAFADRRIHPRLFHSRQHASDVCQGEGARDTNKFDLNRVKRVPVFAKKKADEADHRALPTPAPPISMLIGLCFTSAEAVRKKSRFL